MAISRYGTLPQWRTWVNSLSTKLISMKTSVLGRQDMWPTCDVCLGSSSQCRWRERHFLGRLQHQPPIDNMTNVFPYQFHPAIEYLLCLPLDETRWSCNQRTFGSNMNLTIEDARSFLIKHFMFLLREESQRAKWIFQRITPLIAPRYCIFMTRNKLCCAKNREFVVWIVTHMN